MAKAITINTDSLSRSLGLVNGVTTGRSTMEILNNVRILTDDGEMRFTGSDLETQITTKIECPDQLPEGITVNCRKFHDICRALPKGGDVKLEIDKNGRLIIKSGRSRFSLASLPAKDYPAMSIEENHQSFKVREGDLKVLLSKVQYAMANKDVRYYLNGILLEVTDGSCLTMVATDGHRMSLGAIGTTGVCSDKIQVILPRKAVLELSKSLAQSDNEIQINIFTNYVSFRLPDMILSTKLVDGKFPDYLGVIPKNNSLLFTFDRVILMSAVSRAIVLANEKYRGIRMTLSGSGLTLESFNQEAEEAKEEIEASTIEGFSEGELVFGVNANYLQDVLNSLSTNEVTLAFNNSGGACIVSDGESDKYKAIVMPMKL